MDHQLQGARPQPIELPTTALKGVNITPVSIASAQNVSTSQAEPSSTTHHMHLYQTSQASAAENTDEPDPLQSVHSRRPESAAPLDNNAGPGCAPGPGAVAMQNPSPGSGYEPVRPDAGQSNAPGSNPSESSQIAGTTNSPSAGSPVGIKVEGTRAKGTVRKDREDPATTEPESPTHGRWPKKVKAGRAMLEVTQDMIERSQKLPILLHWRWTGKSINAMYLYQRNIFQGYVGTAMCDVAVDVEIEQGSVIADDSKSDPQGGADELDAAGEPDADDVCELCHKGENRSRCMLTDNEVKADPGHLIRASDGAKSCWVHSKCAHYSRECAGVTRLFDQDSEAGDPEQQQQQLRTALTNAIQTSAQRPCAVCHKPNATLRCNFCSKGFHYSCAVQAHCHIDPYEPQQFACRAHTHRLHEDLEPVQGAPSGYPAALNAMVANFHSGQQQQQQAPLMQPPQQQAESDTASQSSTEDDGGSDSEQRQRSQSGAPEGRGHLQPDKYPADLVAMVGPHMAADPSLLFSSMRQMTFPMEQHLRMHAARMPQDEQGEWCYDRFLGGTTGQKGRHGRCSVCLVQRKGRCGTESAPNSCIRVQAYLAQGKAVPLAPPKQTRKQRVSLMHQFADQEDELPGDFSSPPRE